MEMPESNNTKIVRGEIVIAIAVIVDRGGSLVNRDALKKCPRCSERCTKRSSRANSRSGKTDISMFCSICGYQWNLRFQNPVTGRVPDTDL